MSAATLIKTVGPRLAGTIGKQSAIQRFAASPAWRQVLDTALPKSLGEFAANSIPDALFAGLYGASQLAQGATPGEAALTAAIDFGLNAGPGNVGGALLGAGGRRLMGGASPRKLQEGMRTAAGYGAMGMNMLIPMTVPNAGADMTWKRLQEESMAQQMPQLGGSSERLTAAPAYVDPGGGLDTDRLLRMLYSDPAQAANYAL